MQHALRRIAALVLGSASIGCADDSLMAPVTAPPLVREVAADAPSVDTVRLFNNVASTRAGREQLLGFRYSPPSTGCLGEGEAMGLWHLRFSGFGCVVVSAVVDGNALTMQPRVAAAFDETHASLLLGPEFGDRLTVTAQVETVEQLRVNDTPNAWEVAWLLWQYQDDEHFYYFIPKPNGWEVGKRDPAYPGGQRFLATGTNLTFPIGQTYTVQVTHRANAFLITVDGVAVASFTDTERPYLSGRIALYTEDAAIRVHKVSVRTGGF